MYIPRHIENTMLEMIQMFKVLLVTGSRQVGKTTTLRHLFESQGYDYVTLDNHFDREIALSEPEAFFLNHPGKLIIDEIQYAPSLFKEIKYRVDQSEDFGQYILAGSQTFSLMSGVSESLAGRIGILQMSSLSMREIVGESFSEPFVPTEEFLRSSRAMRAGEELWNILHRGALPQLSKMPQMDSRIYYSSYVSTYLERDVRAITNVKDLGLFAQFLRVVAARISQLVNFTEISKELGINNNTVKSWMSILEASGIIRLVRPYSNHRLKRVVKTPKLYFMDSGLAAHLLQWTTPQTLSAGAMSGPILENFVVSEIIKSFYNKGITDLPITFYRDKDLKEIDLIVEDSGVLYPVEIKRTLSVHAKMAKHFQLLGKAQGYSIGQKTLLCPIDEKRYLSENLIAYPLGAI